MSKTLFENNGFCSSVHFVIDFKFLDSITWTAQVSCTILFLLPSRMTTNSWMVMNWYSDSTCKEFAGQTSFVLNSCVMVQNTTSSTYAYSILSATEDTQTGLGTLGQAFYSDSLCTVASATANVVSFDLQCTPQNNGYYQPSISTSGMPTSWESDGVLMA